MTYTIIGPDELSGFRESLKGENLLPPVREKGCLLIDCAVGIGKSSSMDDTIETAILQNEYDLVIVLCPTRNIINERSWVKDPPKNIEIVNLKPRPSKMCSVSNNRKWKKLETQGMGLYGKITICDGCAHRSQCSWPDQFGKQLVEARVVFSTQVRLIQNPYFIEQLISGTKCKNALVLIDEANLAISNFRRKIKRIDLERFLEVLKRSAGKLNSESHHRFIYLVDLLLKAKTSDLQCPDWGMPNIHSKWIYTVQQDGYDCFGDDFNFIAYDLLHFGRSDPASREKTRTGDIMFAATPATNADFIIYSGSINTEFARYRLSEGIYSPFEGYRFEHPETKWFNIASLTGAKKNFPGNSPQLIDFFAEIIKSRLSQGKRVLLVSKRTHLRLCADMMEKRLVELGVAKPNIVINPDSPEQIDDPKVIPIINYGVLGINLFKEFECVFCLNSYYVTKDAVNSILQDTLASELNIPYDIVMSGNPPRRQIRGSDPTNRYSDVYTMARWALETLEMGTVIQAIGRVRPFTQPREIITFQCGQPPNLEYTQEFLNLADARRFFEIESGRKRSKMERHQAVLAAKNEGLTQTQTAEKLGCSLRTVKRYWKN